MLEIGWQQQCAELRGEEPAPHALQPRVPRSACPHCNHAISAWEKHSRRQLPAVARQMQGLLERAISPRYPIIEAISGMLCAYAAWRFGFGLAAAGALLLVWALLALTAIDFDTQLLPDDITLPLLWVGLLFNLFGVFTDLYSAVLGAVMAILRCGVCTGCSSWSPARGHGLWRFQAARGTGRLAGLATAAADYPVVFAGGRDGRHHPDRGAQA